MYYYYYYYCLVDSEMNSIESDRWIINLKIIWSDVIVRLYNKQK